MQATATCPGKHPEAAGVSEAWAASFPELDIQEEDIQVADIQAVVTRADTRAADIPEVVTPGADIPEEDTRAAAVDIREPAAEMMDNQREVNSPGSRCKTSGWR